MYEVIQVVYPQANKKFLCNLLFSQHNFLNLKIALKTGKLVPGSPFEQGLEVWRS
jgi:hypothetical protein